MQCLDAVAAPPTLPLRLVRRPSLPKIAQASLHNLPTCVRFLFRACRAQSHSRHRSFSRSDQQRTGVISAGAIWRRCPPQSAPPSSGVAAGRHVLGVGQRVVGGLRGVGLHRLPAGVGRGGAGEQPRLELGTWARSCAAPPAGQARQLTSAPRWPPSSPRTPPARSAARRLRGAAEARRGTPVGWPGCSAEACKGRGLAAHSAQHQPGAHRTSRRGSQRPARGGGRHRSACPMTVQAPHWFAAAAAAAPPPHLLAGRERRRPRGRRGACRCRWWRPRTFPEWEVRLPGRQKWVVGGGGGGASEGCFGGVRRRRCRHGPLLWPGWRLNPRSALLASPLQTLGRLHEAGFGGVSPLTLLRCGHGV